MDNMEFKSLWKHFLIDIGKSETALAKEIGKAQQHLNRSISNGSIKFIVFVNILEKYGYTIEIKKRG